MDPTIAEMQLKLNATNDRLKKEKQNSKAIEKKLNKVKHVALADKENAATNSSKAVTKAAKAKEVSVSFFYAALKPNY